MPTSCLASGKQVRHYGEAEVVLSQSRYARNGRVLLRLMDVANGEETHPHAVCTVNLPHVPLRENEVVVKTWGENVGMLGWLIDQRIVSEPLRYACFGGVFLPICMLLTPAED